MRGTEHDIYPAQILLIPNAEGVNPALVNPFDLNPNLGGYHATAARVTVANGRVLLAVDDGHSATGPNVIIVSRYTEFAPAPTRDGKSYVRTQDGSLLVYIRDAACGCGSRLRSWNPLRHMQ